jgi:hypothetical protein
MTISTGCLNDGKMVDDAYIFAADGLDYIIGRRPEQLGDD